MLVNFGPPGICLHDEGSIYLVLRISSTGSFGPGIDLLVPPDRLRGTKSHVTPARLILLKLDLRLIYSALLSRAVS